MVTLTLTDPEGQELRVHWRWDASTHDMSLRLCMEFNQNWREVRPVVLVNGRPLRDTERPWMELPRHATAKADIVFVRLSYSERVALSMVPLPEDERDWSDGWTTTSSIQSEIDALEAWTASLCEMNRHM